MTPDPPLIAANGLKVHFPARLPALFSRRAPAMVQAVDGVDLAIAAGETLALVGESGCGKSTIGRALLRLTEPTAGTVRFRGQDITRLPPQELRPLRRSMQMVFQDPYASLNPRLTIGEAIGEPLVVHGLAAGRGLTRRVHETLETVGLPADVAKRYPHEFSGGQRQRVAIARAVVMRPAFIVADEPISALDVSLQIQILELFEDLKQRFDLTYLFISHDLAVVREIADRVAIMYLGRIVEIGPTEAVFERPQHPYARALLAAIPVPDPQYERGRSHIVLRGEPPSPANPPQGCRFHPRCPQAMPVCSRLAPELQADGDGRRVACHLVHPPEFPSTADRIER